MIIIKNQTEIHKIREASRIVAEVHQLLKDRIEIGITTLELNSLAEEYIRAHNAEPGFLGYKGFPFTICSSINSEVVHGFPSKRRIKNGDVVSIDVGVLKDGYYGDAAFTVGVGNISREAGELIGATKDALYEAVNKAVDGNMLGDVSSTVQYIAESRGFTAIKGFCGHGIGRELHEKPNVFNFGRAGEGLKLKAGMVIAIEPMLIVGKDDLVIDDNDWTARTRHGGLAAHFEHTIVVGKDRPTILSSV